MKNIMVVSANELFLNVIVVEGQRAGYLWEDRHVLSPRRGYGEGDRERRLRDPFSRGGTSIRAQNIPLNVRFEGSERRNASIFRKKSSQF